MDSIDYCLSYKDFLSELNIVDSEMARLAYDVYVICLKEQGNCDDKKS